MSKRGHAYLMEAYDGLDRFELLAHELGWDEAEPPRIDVSANGLLFTVLYRNGHDDVGFDKVTTAELSMAFADLLEEMILE